MPIQCLTDRHNTRRHTNKQCDKSPKKKSRTIIIYTYKVSHESSPSSSITVSFLCKHLCSRIQNAAYVLNYLHANQNDAIYKHMRSPGYSKMQVQDSNMERHRDCITKVRTDPRAEDPAPPSVSWRTCDVTSLSTNEERGVAVSERHIGRGQKQGYSSKHVFEKICNATITTNYYNLLITTADCI